MSAPNEPTVEDSSSEDDLEKFKEAAWSFPTCGNNINTTDGGSKLSRRVSVSKHEHDGNELQTTPEFRVHVAKKLGAILDSCISVISAETSKTPPCTESTKCEEEEGFRLFTTSIPGEIEQPPPVRQRAVPSSSGSDSEMEMRLREAAVSVTDLVSSALPLAVTPSLKESPSSKKIKKIKKKSLRVNEGEEAERQDSNISPALMKKRRRTSQVDCGVVNNCGESLTNAERVEGQKRPGEDSRTLKAKKKKTQKGSD